MSFQKQLQLEIQQALKKGDRDKVRTLRTLLAQLKNQIIAKGDELTKEEEVKVIQKAAKQRKDAIELFKQGGRNDLIEVEKKELAIIKHYLPQQLSQENLKTLIDNIIDETGATSMKDMGKVMSMIMKKVIGQADGRVVQKLVMEKLQG